MRTVRRLYIYVVTLISLELIVWGLINLLQTSLSSASRSATNLLASGLSLVLVGLPFFLLHGWIATREARRDPEEQSSRLRALFFYGARLALLSPVVLELFNLCKEPLKLLLGAAGSGVFSPEVSTPLDRIISIAINAIAWFLLERLLRADWKSVASTEALVEVRRLSRYVWMLYGLVLLVAGVFQTLQYLLDPGGGRLAMGSASFARVLVNGLALILVGAPLWVYCWNIVQRSRDLPGERPSYLRRVVLYALALVPALVVLFAGQSALQIVLKSFLGDNLSPAELLEQNFQQIDLVITFGVLWAYFSRQVAQEWDVEADPLDRAGLRRFYFYPLAAAGNAAAFAGAWKVLGVIVEMLVISPAWQSALRQDLAFGLAFLAVGIPFWLFHWPPMQVEANRSDGSGDHARRSVLRKSYLYLAVFLSVVGLMSAAGLLFYRMINAALGSPGVNLALEAWQQVSLIALLAVWLGYHFSALRADGRLAQHTLVERQSAFPVLVLQSSGDPFYPAFVEALQRQAPRLPVTVLDVAAGQPTGEHLSAQALVLPASLALDPPPALREFLAAYSGRRLVVPLAFPGWTWAGLPTRSARDLAAETALLLRQLAEDQSPRAHAPANAWLITAYVLGAVFALILAFAGFSIFVSNF
jgi:hypothetical protein